MGEDVSNGLSLVVTGLAENPEKGVAHVRGVSLYLLETLLETFEGKLVRLTFSIEVLEGGQGEEAAV